VIGVLTQGIVNEIDKKVVGVFDVDGVANVLASFPISDQELAAYRESPETFFGEQQQVSKQIKEPIEAYEFVLSSYRNTPREKLLEWMAGHPEIERFKALSQLELAKHYSEGTAWAMMAGADRPKYTGT
jgi:hypothetical protein